MPTRFHFSKRQRKKILPLLPGKDTDPGYTAHDTLLDLARIHRRDAVLALT